MVSRTFNQEYWDNQTIKHKEYLNKWVDKHDLQGSQKLIFVSPGFTLAHAFKSKLEEAFEDFIEKEGISSYSAMIDLYGDWVVYMKTDHAKLEALGQIKCIFGW